MSILTMTTVRGAVAFFILTCNFATHWDDAFATMVGTLLIVLQIIAEIPAD
jgi:hypothetical protein